MNKDRKTEASSVKRGKPESNKKRPAPAPKLTNRKGPATRETKTGTKKAPGGGVRKPLKPDKKPMGPCPNKAKNQKGPTALEIDIFERVDEETLDPVQVRCLQFVREYLKCHSIKQAAISMGIPIASAKQIGMRYFRHDFTQKLLKDSMLDIARDRKAIARHLLALTLEEADPAERFQEMGSHRARVSAIELGAKILGVLEKKVSVKGQGSGPVGIMVVPQAQSREEWEKEVLERQANLKTKAVNAESPKEKSVL